MHNQFDQPQLLLLHLFNGLFYRTTLVSQYKKGKTCLDLNEARDDGVLGCSGISWTICKQSASRTRQITTSKPHNSIFSDLMLFLTPNQQCQSTEGRARGSQCDNNLHFKLTMGLFAVSDQTFLKKQTVSARHLCILT